MYIKINHMASTPCLEVSFEDPRTDGMEWHGSFLVFFQNKLLADEITGILSCDHSLTTSSRLITLD
jgi:hypothetical protein